MKGFSSIICPQTGDRAFFHKCIKCPVKAECKPVNGLIKKNGAEFETKWAMRKQLTRRQRNNE